MLEKVVKVVGLEENRLEGGLRTQRGGPAGMKGRVMGINGQGVQDGSRQEGVREPRSRREVMSKDLRGSSAWRHPWDLQHLCPGSLGKSHSQPLKGTGIGATVASGSSAEKSQAAGWHWKETGGGEGPFSLFFSLSLSLKVEKA